MTKQCVNPECGAFLDDKDIFCKICSQKQPEIKKRFFGRKKPDNIIPGKLAMAEDYEDFRLTPQAKALQQKESERKDDHIERLERIEEKINVMLKNHNWLLVSIDNWLQGYRQKEQEQQEEDTESNK